MADRRSTARPLRPVDDVVEVCLESAEENMVSAMSLRANALIDPPWNGWARPLATAAATRDFLARWRRNDPNGTWGDVTAQDGHLMYIDADNDEPQHFPQAGMTRAGEPLYDLTGWMWVCVDDGLTAG